MPLKFRISNKRVRDEMWFALVDNKEDAGGDWERAATFFRKNLSGPTLTLPDEPWLLKIFVDDMLYYGDKDAWDEDEFYSFRFKPFTRMGRRAKAYLEQLEGKTKPLAAPATTTDIDLAELRDALKK
jgi:hypothetical protein